MVPLVPTAHPSMEVGDVEEVEEELLEELVEDYVENKAYMAGQRGPSG